MKSIADINEIKAKMQAQVATRDNIESTDETRVIIGMGTRGIACGAREVFNVMLDEVCGKNIKGVKIMRSGSICDCGQDPIVQVVVPNQETVTYVKVDEEKAKKIISEHIVAGKVCTDYLVDKK